MKTAFWDMPGLRWDDPNFRWGDPSYLLEPGDPGYVGPLSPAPANTPRPTYRKMSNNPIPDAERAILALAEDCADGCSSQQDAVGLKQTREADLRSLVVALKGDPAATPPVKGLLYEFKEKDNALTAAEAARRDADVDGKIYLTEARTALIPILGRDPSPEWELAGFGTTAGNSNAVPGSQAERLAALAQLGVYLTQHPTYEVAAGSPRPEVTSARCQLLHAELSDAREAANLAGTVKTTAKEAKDAAVATLRRRLIAFVDELALLLSDTDPRWEAFGLNIPASPRAPDAAANLVLTALGSGKVLAEWDRGTRSTNDRVLIQVVGVDLDYREYGKSGGDAQEVVKDLPPASTVKVKIIALNGSLEALTGPEAQVVVS